MSSCDFQPPASGSERNAATMYRNRPAASSLQPVYGVAETDDALLCPTAHFRSMIMHSEFNGLFGGFVFTAAGKRRMLLRQGEDERLLKVPRILRRRIIGKFHTGEPIRVAVSEEIEAETGALRQVVSRVLPGTADLAADQLPSASPAPETRCVVRVCSKKNCWRNGGRKLWETLDREVSARGLTNSVEIRQVGCLDRCKQAPNADCGSRAYSRCTSREADSIIARAIGNTIFRETTPP